MKRLLPNIILARLFALIVLAIIVSHVMTFILVVNFYGRDFPPPEFRMHADARSGESPSSRNIRE